MASKKKQQAMVFERVAANSPSEAWSAVTPPAVKHRNTSKGSDETGRRRSDALGRTNMHPNKEVPDKSGQHFSTKLQPNSHSDNLSPDCCQRGIKVTLDNNNMWNQFFRCRTEMIVTKEGSRMFPSCRFRISGLQSSKSYVFVLDIQPADDSRFMWDGTCWRVDEKAKGHVKSQPFYHPDSPSQGQHWMQNPVSFYRLKLTSNTLDQDDKIILHPAQRYIPRLHLIQTDTPSKDLDLNGPDVVTFSFPQTEFMAVTAYHNTQFVKLKVDYNPFAKGLKEEGVSLLGQQPNIKSDKEGGHSTQEQPPVKKSLKSLLATHKPRSLKPANSSVTLDVLENKEEDSASCSSVPAPPKLFSDLIREAHVSLQRCDVNQLCGKQRNVESSKESPPKPCFEDSSVEAVETNGSKKKSKERREHSNSHKHKKAVSLEVTENVIEAFVEKPCKLQEQSEVSAKPHKRPAPLPLPALARFLKQHSLQSKKPKGQQASATYTAPKAFQHSCPGTETPPQKDTDTTRVLLSASAISDTHPDTLETKSNYQCSSPEKQTLDRSTSALQGSSRHGSPLLDHTDHLCHFESTLCPSVTLSGPVESTLPIVCLPHLPPEAVSTTLPSVLNMPLADPNCSTFMFEPLSPASSPEPLPVFPATLALSLDPHQPEQEAKRPLAEEKLVHEDSVFKWHTLLPPPETPYMDTSYTTFQPQPLSLSMTLHNNTQPASTPVYPPHSSIPSFQDGEQSLPFPAELFPLTLPLALSPTFSLDGEGLSPTPSIADLVQFFSNNDELGMGVEFPPAEEVPPPCPPPVLVESTTTDAPQQVRANGAAKNGKNRKRSRSRKQDKPDVDEEVQDYVTMRPNLEEVEEQLFISFTSKEALKLHIPQSSEEPGPATEDHIRTEGQPEVEVQPQMWAEDQPLQESPESPAQSQLQPAIKDSPRPQIPELESELQPGPTTEAQPPVQTVDSPQAACLTGAWRTAEDQQRPVEEVPFEPSIQSLPQRRRPRGPGKPQRKFKQVPVEERETVPSCPSEVTDTQEEEEEEDQNILASEKILLRDMKLMRHRQIIHPVLQEVGLKMSLLDPNLTIDLQYLGVRLPIPAPGVCLQPQSQEQALQQNVSSAFVSRTGKTSDVTQIKGWREKFTPQETSSCPEADKPEAAPVTPETTKKNLSAFCSDMLDEYLENEGKLIEQRAESFSEHLVEPPSFQLPLSSNFSRPLKTTLSSSATLISGFVPPSKRPKLPSREPKMTRRGERKPRVLKKNKTIPNPTAVGPPESSPTVETTTPSSEPPPPSTETEKEKSSTTPEPIRRKKRLKPKSSTQSLDLPRPSADMAPLESDTELDPPNNSHEHPVMTRALLKQRDLEDGVMWEGRPRTCVTEERAAIALTSLFTLSGFVSENPTAPIQLPRRQTPSCLNDFCRLGCICSSLSRNRRSSHCGRPDCMFGCSCLKQKVVLLKHLDGSDSGSSQHSRGHRRRRNKKRMKMAYVLKEADSAAYPAERIQTLWKKHTEDFELDPVRDPKSLSVDPVTGPEETSSSQPPIKNSNKKTKRGQVPKVKVQTLVSSCARVRVFHGKNTLVETEVKTSESGGFDDIIGSTEQQGVSQGESMTSDAPTKTNKKKPPKEVKAKKKAVKSETNDASASNKTTDSSGLPAELKPSTSVEPKPTQNSAEKPKFTKLSDLLKNLTIMAECSWDSVSERNTVIMTLCKFLAQGRLEKPFWIQNYLIRPVKYMVKEEGEQQNQYRVYISKPLIEKSYVGKSESTVSEEPQEKASAPEEEDTQHWEEEEPVEDWQRAVDSETDGSESMENEVDSDSVDEEELSRQVTKDPVLPFMSRVSPAGFLSAGLKQPDNSDVVQVNGKFYPLAKIQLGLMGALHPANRLAAYLTGRVGVAKRPPSSSSTDSTGTSCNPPVTPTVTPLVTPPVTPTFTPTYTPSSSEPPKTSSVPKIVMKVPPRDLLTTALLQSKDPLPIVPVPSSQKMVLKMVQTKAGEKLFRTPEGKLVKLVPLSQLKNLNSAAQKGVSITPTLKSTSTAPSGPLGVDPVIPASGLSGLRNFRRPQDLVVVHSSDQGTQKVMSTFKILPQPFKQAQLLLRIQPSSSSSEPAGPVGVLLTPPKTKEGEVTKDPPPAAAVTLTPAPIDTPAAQHPSPAPPAPPTGSQTEQQVKHVDVTTEKPLSEEDTESSSDEGNSDEEKMLEKDEQRPNQKQREKLRRQELVEMFENLGRVTGLQGPSSRVTVLDKATSEILTLVAAEVDLLKRKRRLRRKRDGLLGIIAPTSDSSGPSDLTINCTDEKDRASAVAIETEPGCAEDPFIALQALRCCLDQTDTSDLELLNQVRQEISAQQDLMRGLKGAKKRLKQQRESLVRQVSTQSGQSRKMILTKLDPPSCQGPGEALLPELLQNDPPTVVQVDPPRHGTCSTSHDAPEKRQEALPIILTDSRLKTHNPAAALDTGFTKETISDPQQGKEVASLPPLLHQLKQKSVCLLPGEPTCPGRAATLLQDHALSHLRDLKGGQNGHLETQPSIENLKGGVLAPPPLLQMRMDATKKVEPDVASSQGPEDGVAWRPMPRLVPLGLKGTPPI